MTACNLATMNINSLDFEWLMRIFFSAAHHIPTLDSISKETDAVFVADMSRQLQTSKYLHI